MKKESKIVKKLTAIFFILFLCSGIVFFTNVIAGTTGKIVGRIVDEVSQEPLPGANIVVEGTSMGAA